MVMTATWKSALHKKLVQMLGAKKGETLKNKYSHAFSTSYIEDASIDVAIGDISQMEELSAAQPINIEFYVAADKSLHLKLYQFNQPIPLSDVLPMLENLDLHTLNEHPYRVSLKDTTVWISDFNVTYAKNTSFNIKKVESLLQETFIRTCFGLSENDGFNKLVLGAQLSWQEITILRAYAKYLRQTGFRFSQAYIEQALVNNAEIAKDLVAFFKTKMDPKAKTPVKNRPLKVESDILHALEEVSSLDEDRILRRMLSVIQATLRTNYFQQINKQPKDYLSFKLESAQIPELPLPLPLYEVFVYSPRFEGIHLRNAKVARGGIRWSDRREDFRTEVLGLMKAQKVKNAVIIPSGAKGGFVLKSLPPNATREATQQEVITCYKSFIRGLLDLTDNLDEGKIIPPIAVKCYDDADPYLVVAADKGTATFSDTANALSKEYNFWLGDAFASGGSVGYDHKKMGITARGAWESVKRHFNELDLDVTKNDFTVVGIGDMSGDVFGNGLLYTPRIKMVAAFDHRHIFLDPNPNPAISFKERERLFNLPTSSWEDYNPKLISNGGGVYKRSSKSITLSAEMKKILGTQENTFTPNELIRVILKAPVDLLWNGGIGTYVKASTESHADVGDKTNEFCRIDGGELRCRVVGEGGNLGFTQLGRVEYALNGGLINTDFIDNSAGVDCSDHEVNIKILLNNEVVKGRLTEKKRNTFLAKMTDEVGSLVLADNYNQALTLSVASFFATDRIGIHQSYIKDLESAGIINRAVEFLPDDKKLLERKAAGQGLTRPELAVLLAYTKIHLKNEILKSDIPEDPYLNKIINTAFPSQLCKSYGKELSKHYLHREIVATQLSNLVVNEMGITFIYNLQNETGASVAEVIRAQTIASQVFEAPELLNLIGSLNYKIPLATQYQLLSHIWRLLTLSTRWFIRHKTSKSQSIGEIIQHFKKNVHALEDIVPTLMAGSTKNYLESLSEEFTKVGISLDVARKVAGSRAMYTALNVIKIATTQGFELQKTAKLYFGVGEQFNLLWFRDRMAMDNREGYWDTLARLSLRDELDTLQTRITIAIMKHNKNEQDTDKLINSWLIDNHRAFERWEKILNMLHSSTNIDYVMFFIALRELSDLI
jgi:glutamate dehydrogenase